MRLLIGVLGGLILVILLVYAAGRGVFGEHEGPGEVTRVERSAASVAAGAAAVRDAAGDLGVARPKQILFGDLHVHTTFSFDAFSLSLPVMGGEGAHPPADACDFARYCSALDFWSINDHAFSITPEHWRETVDSLRQCNAVSSDASNPDTVAYLGWEWTQVGMTPEQHYGHKNVVLRGLSDDEIPARPIAAVRPAGGAPGPYARGVFALTGDGRNHELARYYSEWEDAAICDSGVPTRELPVDCIEEAPTPAELFGKLDEWGHDAFVIPHGTTWGFYTPPGSSWDKQLAGAMHDPERQNMIEVYSGHGDSELYRDFRAVVFDDEGRAHCPEPQRNYLPTCWRIGDIVRERCLADGEAAEECEGRAVQARDHAANAGVGVRHTLAGLDAEELLDAGQCRDCPEPAFNYRPGGSAQYILALGNFDEDPNEPRRFRMGMMASSDNHYARPGTGYKEVHRSGFTESQSTPDDAGAFVANFAGRRDEAPESRSRPYTTVRGGFDVFEAERQGSFFLTGGLIGVHSQGRDRDAIWRAMESKEVYGTSGPRMLMWFDLLNAPGSRGRGAPMGSEVEMADVPIFQARAVGSFEQEPGCPASASDALGEDRLAALCKGECYAPSDRRRPVTRIEIVRIRPQQSPDEDPARLIDDPWKRFTCDGDPAGCVVTFTDPEFPALGRDVLYYARAFEAEAPGINAGNVRCEGADGKCESVRLCPGPELAADDCLAPHEPRAWSSPIWLDPPGA